MTDTNHIEDVILLDKVFNDIIKDKDSRGYIFVKEDQDYVKHGFRALGFAYKKVCDSASLDTQIHTKDMEMLSNFLDDYIKLSPYIKYHSKPSEIIKDAEIFHFLQATNAENFFLFDNQGGMITTLENVDKVKRLKKVDYIGTATSGFLEEKGIILPDTREVQLIQQHLYH